MYKEMDIRQTQTILYSFTAGYMVSQLNILGFALGCGFMFTLNYIPHSIKSDLWERCKKTFTNLPAQSLIKDEVNTS
jgi:hypothetical protein